MIEKSKRQDEDFYSRVRTYAPSSVGLALAGFGVERFFAIFGWLFDFADIFDPLIKLYQSSPWVPFSISLFVVVMFAWAFRRFFHPENSSGVGLVICSIILVAILTIFAEFERQQPCTAIVKGKTSALNVQISTNTLSGQGLTVSNGLTIQLLGNNGHAPNEEDSWYLFLRPDNGSGHEAGTDEYWIHARDIQLPTNLSCIDLPRIQGTYWLTGS